MTHELSELVPKIIEAHRQVDQAGQTMLQHARQAGQLLNEAKKLVPHGQYGPWLRDNFPQISQSTVYLYRRIADHWDDEVFRSARQNGEVITSIADWLRVYYGHQPPPEGDRDQEAKSTLDETTDDTTALHRDLGRQWLRDFKTLMQTLDVEQLIRLEEKRERLMHKIQKLIQKWLQDAERTPVEAIDHKASTVKPSVAPQPRNGIHVKSSAPIPDHPAHSKKSA